MCATFCFALLETFIICNVYCVVLATLKYTGGMSFDDIL